jgi:hypothetical protein
VRVFKVKPFKRFQRRERISDTALCKAVADAELGRIDADLGGGLIKQRVPRPGQGKSGGFRAVIAYQRASRAVFLLGFAKSARANIDDVELAALQRRAAGLLAAPDAALETMIADEELTEVDCGQSTQD